MSNAEVLRSLCEEAMSVTSVDTGSMIWFEHVNLVVGDHDIAELFYAKVLGLTIDPTKPKSSTRWYNIGRQQFHIGTYPGDIPQVCCGSFGLALPDLDALRARLAAGVTGLSATKFRVEQDIGDAITVIGPWGNVFHIFSSVGPAQSGGSESARVSAPAMARVHHGAEKSMAVLGGPGIRFVQFECEAPQQIAKFYQRVYGAPESETSGPSTAVVSVGPGVQFIFTQAVMSQPRKDAMRGMHVCVYVSNFTQSFEALESHGLIWTNPKFQELDTCDSLQEARQSRQYRFRDVIDLDDPSRGVLIELEHETRSLLHHQFMKLIKYFPC